MTMTDPVFYTEPVKAEKRWAFVPNGHLLPYECNEEAWIKRLEELERGDGRRHYGQRGRKRLAGLRHDD